MISSRLRLEALKQKGLKLSRCRQTRCRHRQIIPGATFLITKKCNGDRFFTRPSSISNEVLLYTLLLKLAKYGLQLHGYVFLSNHFHLVCTDPLGNLPKFMREFLSESSCAIQVGEKARDAVWSSKRYSSVELLDLDAAQRKLVYCWLNPTKAGLSLPKRWPGLTSAVYNTGDVVRANRPGYYFSDRRAEVVSATLVSLTEVFDNDVTLEQSEQDIVDLYESELAEIIMNLKTRWGKNKKNRGRKFKFLSVDQILSTPRSTRGHRPMFEMNPRFASRNPATLLAALCRLKWFEIDLEAAREKYLGGKRKVVFPVGTYGFRVLYEVIVQQGGKAA